jgi:hypothetical protein
MPSALCLYCQKNLAQRAGLPLPRVYLIELPAIIEVVDKLLMEIDVS